MTAARTAETITSLDVFLNSAKVGTIVRTPGDFNAFSLDPAYRAIGGIPVLSLSLRAASGGLRKDPRPVAGSLPPFFANLPPEVFQRLLLAFLIIRIRIKFSIQIISASRSTFRFFHIRSAVICSGLL